jgi:hypothetical protein
MRWHDETTRLYNSVAQVQSSARGRQLTDSEGNKIIDELTEEDPEEVMESMEIVDEIDDCPEDDDAEDDNDEGGIFNKNCITDLWCRTNNNPGNIHFRAEALRLRPWYESSTKEEKYEISNLLLESVLSKGGRFLERKDGEWYEVIGGGARRKASQALRERIRGKVGGGLNSSLTTVKSVEEEDGDGNNIVHGEKVGV